MKRRGPPKKSNAAQISASEIVDSTSAEPSASREIFSQAYSAPDIFEDHPKQVVQDGQLTLLDRVSHWPFHLDQKESEMLNHYIQRFSRTYPAFAAPNNPFLRVFMPLTMQSRTVLDAVLALSCVQSWENGTFLMEAQMLKYRHRALKGSM